MAAPVRTGRRLLESIKQRKAKALQAKKNFVGTVDRTTMKPSERLHFEASNSLANSMFRPMIPVDPIPYLYRVFNETVQRVPLHYTSLSSWAAFILVVDSEREAVGWFGEECKLPDRKLASELGLQVLRQDLRKTDATYFPFTSESNDNLRILRYMLPKIWCDELVYRTKKNVEERKKMCFNNPVSVGMLDKFIDGSYALRETSFASVDEELGSVPRLRFVDVEKNSIVVVNHGDQWDIWVSRGCTDAEEEFARSYVIRLASSRTKVSPGGAPITASAIEALKGGNPNVRTVKQGCERVLFRCHMKALTDFEPLGKCVPWAPPDPGSVSSYGDEDGGGGGIGGAMERILVDPFEQAVEGLTGMGGAVFDAFSVVGAAGGGAAAGGRGLGGKGKADVGPSSGGVRVQGTRSEAGVDSTDSVAEKKDGTFAAAPGENGNGAKGSKDSLFSFFGKSHGPEVGTAVPIAVPSGSEFVSAPPKPKGHPFEGRDMLTHDSMDFIDDLSMGVTKSNQVIEAATYEPFILVGYQIEIDEGLYRGRHVVTATRKTPLFHKSQFRLSSLDVADTWIKLKRGHKAGVPFRVLRKVFDPF